MTHESPITFENDGRQKVETGTHSFEIEVPDIPLEPNAYRKIPIVFTGTGEGLRGKITADSAHKKVIPTICEIEIENTSKGGGLLKGWEIINSSFEKYAWYEPDPICKVQINIGVPFGRPPRAKMESVTLFSDFVRPVPSVFTSMKSTESSLIPIKSMENAFDTLENSASWSYSFSSLKDANTSFNSPLEKLVPA